MQRALTGSVSQALSLASTTYPVVVTPRAVVTRSGTPKRSSTAMAPTWA
jgi:hypothetical protein